MTPRVEDRDRPTPLKSGGTKDLAGVYQGMSAPIVAIPPAATTTKPATLWRRADASKAVGSNLLESNCTPMTRRPSHEATVRELRCSVKCRSAARDRSNEVASAPRVSSTLLLSDEDPLAWYVA